MFLWAIEHRHRESLTKAAVVWCVRLYTAQLAFIALTQVEPVKEYIAEHASLQTFTLVSGLQINETGVSAYMVRSILP